METEQCFLACLLSAESCSGFDFSIFYRVIDMFDYMPAIIIRKETSGVSVSYEDIGLDQLPNEPILIEVEYSNLNYKDALAVSRKGPIAKIFPLIPGIDSAGEVVESTDPNYPVGSKVLLTGWGVGEKFWGGFAKYQRVRPEWLVPLPKNMTTRMAMMVGTAGLEAALAIDMLESLGLRPEDDRVLVTGGAGGVGVMAILMLLSSGYNVSALTADDEQANYLRGIGVKDFANDARWSREPRALETQTWSATIDTVGSSVLARVLAETRYNGLVASCGLAGGSELVTTVMPFILRGIRLIGVDSVMQPFENRIRIWNKIASILSEDMLNVGSVATIGLADVQKWAEVMMAQGHRGRILIDMAA